jgi:hypothetical protein
MRKLMIGLGVGLCVGAGAVLPAFAEAPKSNAYENDGALSTSHRMTTAEQRIYERASFEARERLARIESRHRQGVSAVRPAVYSGPLLGTETPHFGASPFYAWYCPCP